MSVPNEKSRFARFLQFLWERTDNITKWVQAIALVGTAGWAVFNFSVKDRPNLEAKAIVGATDPRPSYYAAPAPGLCVITVNFSVAK
jgi:hypothetical protein